MESNPKEDQTAGKMDSSGATPVLPARICDYRLPHEIAAAILAAAYEVVIKKLECERETRK
jgi:hypothetical protein